METKTQVRKLCGFCQFGPNHQLCPGGVRNGNGSIFLCECDEPTCNAGKPRCTECNNRDEAEIGPDWRCINRDDCADAVEARLSKNSTVKQIRAIREQLAKTELPASATQRRGEKSIAKPASAVCLCGCEGTTKGGKFLPGHDARYLSALVSRATEEGADDTAYAEALSAAEQVSPAFALKFAKRAPAFVGGEE